MVENKDAEAGKDEETQHTNFLINSTSPYLLQHAHNPVNWFEWGDEALLKAQNQKKPIFLSIGYSACHWCHVMEREVFADEEIAKLLNQFFICIKVDREERPDLDTIYMQSTMALTGNGGWPMSVFLTPEEEPFMAGTYFRRAVFEDVVRQIIALWRMKQEEISSRTDAVHDHLKETLSRSMGGEKLVPGNAVVAAAIRWLEAFDKKHGGVLSGRTNKFPPHTQVDLLLRGYERNGSEEFIDAINTTLTKMVRGGICDHLAGGVHHYSTDPQWLVPHFEKMLYDQALVSDMYLDAYQATNNPLYAETAHSIFGYVLGDLQSPEGGFYSSRDAESIGMEGGYYLWTFGEVRDVLGADDTKLFASYYNVTEGGNWYDFRHPGPPVPYNVLNITKPASEVAGELDLNEAEFLRRIEGMKRKLLAARVKRESPALDDKVLAEWNGMMIGSLAKGSRVFGEPRYVAAAEKAAQFVLDNMIVDGKLMRSYRVGKAQHIGYLSDYVFMIDGLLHLYEATFHPKWIEHAEKLAIAMMERYDNPENGGFFYTAEDGERLIVRLRDAVDGALPSSNQFSAHVLLRLATLTGKSIYKEKAEAVIKTYSGRATESPASFDVLMRAVDYQHGSPKEIVIMGDPGDSMTKQMLAAVYGAYLPNKIVTGYNGTEVPDNIGRQIPLLKGRKRVDGKTTAYVCENYQCREPVTTVEALKVLLSDNVVENQ